MMNLSFIQNYSPLLVLIVAWILAFIGFKLLKIEAPTWSVVVLSCLLALMFASSTSATSYIADLIPLFVIIMVTIFLVIFILAFTGNFAMFQKPLAIIGFIVAVLLILVLAFNRFPAMSQMLPGTSDSHLTREMANFKDWLYSETVVNSIIFIASIVLVGFFLIKKS